MERLNRLVRYWSPASPNFLKWSVDSLSGPKAFEALAFLITVLVLSVVIRSVSAALFVLVSFVTGCFGAHMSDNRRVLVVEVISNFQQFSLVLKNIFLFLWLRCCWLESPPFDVFAV